MNFETYQVNINSSISQISRAHIISLHDLQTQMEQKLRSDLEQSLRKLRRRRTRRGYTCNARGGGKAAGGRLVHRSVGGRRIGEEGDLGEEQGVRVECVHTTKQRRRLTTFPNWAAVKRVCITDLTH